MAAAVVGSWLVIWLPHHQYIGLGLRPAAGLLAGRMKGFWPVVGTPSVLSMVFFYWHIVPEHEPKVLPYKPTHTTTLEEKCLCVTGGFNNL